MKAVGTVLNNASAQATKSPDGRLWRAAGPASNRGRPDDRKRGRPGGASEAPVGGVGGGEVHRTLSKGDTDSKKNDGRVSLNEFYDYYSNVSASIDDDEYFKLMITNAWNLDNKTYGKAWGAEY